MSNSPIECSNCGKRHRILTEDQCRDRSMTERTLQDRIRDRARRRGWRVSHVGKGIAAFDATGAPIFVTPAEPGLPDLMLAKTGHKLIWMELKRELGEVSPEQWAWLKLLNEVGCRAVIIRPSDLREKRVTAILEQGSPL